MTTEKKKSDALAPLRDATLAAQEIALTPDNVRRFINDKATNEEIALFLNICVMYQLNPFKREVFLIKYGNEAASFVVGYEVYLKRAERTTKWDGFEIITEGSAKDMTLKAICKVFRKDWGRALVHEVYLDEYLQMKDEMRWDNDKQRMVKTGKRVPTAMWQNKPRTMLKKVAIEQAHRMAFPDEFAGMPYAEEEMPVEADAIRDEDVAVTKKRELDDKVKAIMSRPLANVKDEFSGDDETAATPAAKVEPPAPKKEEPKSDARLDDRNAVTAVQLQQMRAGIDALVAIGVLEETIFTGVMAKVEKAFKIKIVELGDMKKEHAERVIVYLAKWAESLNAEDAARKAADERDK